MGSSSPLVCHTCWDQHEKNWHESCPHAKEVFEQGVRKGREIVAANPTCHFCQSKDVGVTKDWPTGKVFVECFDCGARGPRSTMVAAPSRTRRESAIEGWNRVVPIRGLGPFSAAFRAGNEAMLRGDHDNTNPNLEGTQEWRAWKAGWDHVGDPIRKASR